MHKNTQPDTDLTQPGQAPGHENEQPGQTGAPGRDVAPGSDAPDGNRHDADDASASNART